jgi:signal transduction histidine kinase
VDVAGVAGESWNALAGHGGAQQIRFELEIDEEAGTVCVDLDALRQIFTNLFDNSLRYTAAGGRILCSARRQGEGTAISVRDTGVGISREHLPRIFERFWRADTSRSREEGGTGLGLSIVKHLVEAHGGRVWAQSDLGRGTTVAFWVPDSAL